MISSSLDVEFEAEVTETYNRQVTRSLQDTGHYNNAASKDRNIDQWNKIESPEEKNQAPMDTLPLTKEAKIYNGESEVSEVAQSCLTLCDPMDCSLQCFSIHGIFQARVLEWVAISCSRGSSQPRDRTWVSHIVGRCFKRQCL